MKEAKNSTNEFNELKKILKDLSKVEAPDNFELNLMTKIQNKNFEINSEKKKRNWLSWSLTPAVAFAATVFALFFFFGGNSTDNDSLETFPKLIENSVAVATPEQSNVNDSRYDKINRPIQKRSITQNDDNKQYPFDKSASLNLDEYLNSDNITPTTNRSQLASQTYGSSTFDGFFLREVRKYSKEDSLKKSDSLTVNK